MWWSVEGTQPADKGIKKASSKRANTLVKNHFDDVSPSSRTLMFVLCRP